MFSHATTHIEFPTIEAGGTEIGKEVYDSILDLSIKQSIQLPDVATLRVSDPDLELTDRSLFDIGVELKVTLTSGDKETREAFSGDITAVSVEPGDGHELVLVVTALDKGHRLTRNVRVRTFTEMTDADIVASIAAEHKLQSSADTGTKHEYLLQDETDSAFLSRRADDLGYRWWVKGDTLHFEKVDAPPQANTLTWGENLKTFKLRLSSSGSLQSVTVRSWDPDSQQPIVGSATLKATRAEGLASDAEAVEGVASSSGVFGNATQIVSRTLPDTVAADALAESIIERSLSSQARVRATAEGDPGLTPGAAVKLEGLGKRLSGVYSITTTEHVFAMDKAYTTRFACDGVDSVELADLIRRPADRKDRVTEGLMVGTVTAINDQEQPARIKVQLPTLSDEDESAWARVASPGAGNTRGWQVLPEINDEVIVGFEQGDPQRPVILGGLWSKANPPPLDNATAVSNDLVATRAFYTRKGHKIEVKDDESGTDNSITISLAGEKGSIEITEDGGISITTPKDLEITTDGAITMKATGDISLEGQNVSITAQSKVAVEGVQIEGKGTSKVSFEALQVEAKASGSLSLSAGGMTEVKGAMVKLN